jgi:hypothetical protein
VKRALIAIAGTIAGLVALLGYKSGPVKRAEVAAQPPASPDQTAPPTTAAAAPPTSSAAPTAPAPAQGGDGEGGDDGQAAPPAPATPAPATPAPATPAPTTTPAPAGGTRTLTGPDVPNQYGDVQVQLTLHGSKIVNVKALQMPFDRQRSYEISQQAAPLLAQEVMQAQSANIDLLSGATYTSESYAQSVQAALDQARA